MTACFPFAAATVPAAAAITAATVSRVSETVGKSPICFVKQTTTADQDTGGQIIARWVRALLSPTGVSLGASFGVSQEFPLEFTRVRRVGRRPGPTDIGPTPPAEGSVLPPNQSVSRRFRRCLRESKQIRQDTKAMLMRCLLAAVSWPPR